MLRQPWAVAAAVLVLAVYAAVLDAMPKNAFWSPDEGAKFIQLHSIEWRDGLHYSIAYGGARIDPEFAFYPTRCRFEDLYPVPLDDGGVKFHWPIWFPLGTGLLVAAFGPIGLFIVPLVSGWLIGLLAGHLIRAWNPRLAPLAILTVGLATPIAFFSVTFWEHTLATLLCVAALAVIAGAQTARARTLWVVGPLLLAAAALRIEMLLFGVALLCAWLAASRWARPEAGAAGRAHTVASRSVRHRRIVLGLVVAVALMLLFTAVIPERHRWMLSVLPDYVLGSFAKLPYLLETLTAVWVDSPGNQAPEIANLWRYGVLLACIAAAAAPFLRSGRAEAIALFAGLTVVLELSLYLVVRPEAYVSLHGFLPVAPFILLAAYAYPSAWRERRHAQLVIASAAAVYAVLVFAVIFVFLVTDDGVTPVGLEWGSRYLFTLYPIGAVLALAGVYEVRRSLRAAWFNTAVVTAAAALLVCGVLLEARGVWTLVQSRRLVAGWQNALTGGPPVVTDVWWLPAAMAPLFISQEVHCVRQGDLREWLPIALQRGVDEFTYASFAGLDPGRIDHPGVTITTEGVEELSGLRLTRIRIAPADGG